MCHRLIDEDVRLVPKRLELPLFVLSRNRIKQNHLESLRQHIARKTLDYTKHCQKENSSESKTRKGLKHVLGRNHLPSQPCPQKRTLFLPSSINKSMLWSLPPNLYNVGTAKYMATAPDCETRIKLKRKRDNELLFMLKKQPQTQDTSGWKFYENRDNRRYCNRYKGIFLSNPRNRRASTRIMITSAKDCYRDFGDPGPNHYFPKNGFIETTAHPIVKLKQKPSPHIFLPRSSVPLKQLSIYAKNKSFAPGPGHYETRYQDSCPCSRKLTYMPGLQLMIEDEKRKKFRRLPYQKIKSRLYCCPDWRHVVGHGFRHLFRQPRARPLSNLPKVRTLRQQSLDQNLHIFADTQYIDMINNPKRSTVSLRQSNLIHKATPRISYNHEAKPVKCRSSKKVAFNSGEERFKDILRAPNLTKSELELIKLRLPVDLQLRNRPVMRVRPDQIKSKLYEKQKSKKEPSCDVVLQKQTFKFLPLPSPKVLVSSHDIKPRSWKPLHNYDLDPTVYFKDEEKANEVRKLLFPDVQ